MKRVLFLLSLVISHLSFAQPPALIHYQGRLLNGTNLYTGAANIAFRFYTNSAGGTHHFESTNSATVVDGLYSTIIGEYVTLGSLAPTPDTSAGTAPWHRQLYRASRNFALVADLTVALLGGGLFAAKEFYESYSLREETQALILSEAELSWRYREISATFPQLGLDNDTLRRVTDRQVELLECAT